MSDLSDLKLYCQSREEWDAVREEMEGQTLEANALILATNPLYWENALQWMNDPDDVKKAFMDGFMKDGAVKARMVAAMGLSALNRAPAKGLLEDARNIKQRMDAGRECKTALMLLGNLLVDLVDDGDHKTLADAARLLKGDNGDHKKGAFAQAPGDVWKAFCQYHIETGSLPTKGKLDELAGIEDGRKIRGPLGLNGLPERL